VSTEKLTKIEVNNLTPFLTPKGDEKVLKKRVDINDLLSRVRDEKKKANKVNLIFFGLFTSLVFIVGVILSF
jgi:hypothetical protein